MKENKDSLIIFVVVATLTVLSSNTFFVLPLFARIIGWLIILFFIFKPMALGVKVFRITKIKDHDERIQAAAKLLETDKMLKKSERDLNKPYVETKLSLLNIIAVSYMSKDEYYPALQTYAIARSMFYRLDNRIKTDSPKLDIREQCDIWEGRCLCKIGELEAASQMILPLLKRLGKLNQIGRASVISSYLELSVQCGDTEKARKAVDMMAPDLYAIAKKVKRDELIYDAMLYEGIVHRMEGNFVAARQKLEHVVRSCEDKSNVTQARQELEFMFGR